MPVVVSRRPRRQLPAATRDSRCAHGSTHHAGRAARDRRRRNSEAPRAAARAWLPHPDRWRAAPPRLHERLLRLRRWSRQRRVRRARVEGTIRQHRRHDGQSGQAGGSRRRQARTEEAAHRSRKPLPDAPCAWRRQDDAAEREPVSGDRVSERAERTSVSHLFGVSLGRARRSFARRCRRCVDDGVKYIQIDAPRYSYYLDPKWREYLRTEMGVEPRGGARRSDQAWTTPASRRARARAPSWPSTSVAATTGASGTPRAATTRSPRSCSTS